MVLEMKFLLRTYLGFTLYLVMQEKAANAAISLSKCVRTVMGPSGTVVTFPEDMGLPSIFDPKPSRYDNQPREILALVCNGIDFIF